jgi:hypothetical protein
MSRRLLLLWSARDANGDYLFLLTGPIPRLLPEAPKPCCSPRITNDAIALNGVGTAPVFQYVASHAESSAGDDISFPLRA